MSMSRRRLSWIGGGALTTMIVAGLGAGFAAPAVAAEEPDLVACPWMDTSKTPDERAELLLDASTQHQKYRWLNEQSANSPTQTTFSGVSYPVQVDCTPLVKYANGAEGVHSSAGTTAWPAPIAVASTWNLALGEEKATMHGRETFDKGTAVVLGPGVASGRTPLSGRTPEYFGEDALLSGLMGAANVRGLEEGNPDKPVLANLKHYVANEQETDRAASSSNMDDRTFHQVYDLPYQIAIAESDPDSIMCSYNQINGVYACENGILTSSLREEAGFTGYVMSDFGSVHSTAASLNAGLDQELNRPIWFTPEKLDAALAAGEITQERIDEAAFYVVRAYIRGGLFDNPVPTTPVAVVTTDEHKAAAREIAEQSAVLLKNESTLPLSGQGLRVAVIGQTASATATDGISAQTACSAKGFGSGGVLNCAAVVDPLTAITQKVEAAGGTVYYDSGADLVSASVAAASADVAIVFGYLRTGEFSDPTDLRLDGNGDALIEAVADAAPKTVAVLNSGTAVEMPWIDDVDAVVNAWYSGEQQGPALAALLWGDVNFSGKLPMTFPTSADATPTSTPAQYPGVFSNGSTTNPGGEIRQVDYSEGLEVGYKWYDEQQVAPLFAFGYGLSYTSYEYSELSIEQTEGAPEATVAFTITNTGDRAGAEIPQVYLTLPDAAGEPSKRLVGFDRVELAAGESTRVEVAVSASDVNKPYSIWDTEAQAWTIVDGAYGVTVGTSSQDAALTGRILVGDIVAPDAPIVTVDPTDPNGANDWYVSPITLTASSAAELRAAAGIDVAIDGDAWTPAEGPVVIDADGEHSVAFRAVSAEDVASEPTVWTGRLDATAPTASAALADGLVTVTADDATSGVAVVEYALAATADAEPTEWTAYSEPFATDATLPFVHVRATDVAGNVSDVTVLDSSSGEAPGESDSDGAAGSGGTAGPSGIGSSSGTGSGEGDLAATGGEFAGTLLLVMLGLLASGALLMHRSRRRSRV